MPLCHSHIRARHRHKQTHKHIAIVWNPLQRKSSVRKTDSRHKLNLAFSVCNNDTVRAQLLNLYLFAAVLYWGGTYTYTQCLHCNANLCQQTSFKGQLNCECFCSGCLWVCPHCQCCRLSSLLSPHTHSVTSGMLSQRECLMNVENENTSLMNSVTQLVQLIFLWRCWVKWSHGWLSHCFAILFYF